ncbi:MAG TPA: M48 family metallopeptidase [Candidatus Saccharimonadales bacterium]|nr:M48 family metallopeptidase [Candidatus Saccharimonadales bacterium]
MKSKPEFTTVGFAKTYLLPALFTFLVPAFALWFFSHVEAHYDRLIRDTAITQIKVEPSLNEEQRAQGIAFYTTTPVSKILASHNPKAKKLQAQFQSVQTRYGIFRWMKRISQLCLVVGAGAFLAVALGILLSFRSQNALYWSLRVGWNVLRCFALIEVLGQGTLIVALSFWMTAFWFEVYYVKLIGIAGILALCAVAVLVTAIFRKLPAFSQFEGRLLKEEDAPALWQRVREMAGRLAIAPPDNIFVGIDDNFFVTEHSVEVGGQRYNGRTLFMSLSLLKTMSRSEADGVLAHELAHFSGADTVYSNRISPLLGKYAHYLEALAQGGITLPIFHFMHLFWHGYQLALNKLRREREFRADKIGAELTSPRDIAQALVKITAYCQYRAKVQNDLFGKQENVQAMDVYQRIENGFPAFMTACVSGNELSESGTSHPFDSHPPLARRIENIGLEPQTVLQSEEALQAVTDSWFSAIEGAARIEAEQWNAFEKEFHKAHQEKLAWTFKPQGETEISHVMKYFPTIEFTSPKGITAVLDYEKISLSDWEAPVYLATLTGCRVDESLGGHKLILDYAIEGKKQTRKISHKDLTAAAGSFLPTFEKYYSRHLTAVKFASEMNEADKLKEAA